MKPFLIRTLFLCALIGFGWFAASPILRAADLGLKTLPDHLPAAVAHLSAIGTLADTNRLNLSIGLPLRDAPGLDDFLAQIADPASPNYRHYLTPAEFTEKFGPTEADYQRVIDFAKQSGFTITATNGNRLLLNVSGRVAEVQKAFHVTLKTYRHPTGARDFFAPDSEPSVNASLPIADISGLSSYGLPQPKIVKMNSTAATSWGTGSGSGGTYLGYDFRAAYLPGVTLTGAGQTVGLVQFDGFYAGDITSYETAAGLPAVPLQTVLLDSFSGTPTTGANSGNIEVSLDIEMVASMAPGLSKIVVFEGNPNAGFFFPNDVLSAMADSNSISQFSCSWGWSGGPTNTTDTIFKKMAAQGQSFFTASGDSDAFTTGASSTNGVDNPSLANTPASSPYLTTVGGTTLTTTGGGGAWSSEAAWNWGLHSGSYVGSSGGISSYYAMPSWQTNASMTANGGSTTYRNIPDVALTADNIHVKYGNGTNATVGGTSCAAPLWAGLAALINQQAVTAGRATIGFINPAIYSLGKSTNYNPAFHDITTGNNVWPSSPNSFYAVSGYDLCTGWGTPAGQSLINVLAGAPEPLGILPATGFTASGTVGGPFSQTSTTFQLTNYSTAPLSWSVINTSSWLQVSSTNGTLPAGSSASLTASLTAAANDLAVGTYGASLKFTNRTSHVVQAIPFTLKVVSSLVQNGGFETGDFTGWTLVGNTVVSQGPFGSTIYNAVESSSAYPAVVHTGTYGAFMGDTQLATLSQTLATIPGENYLVSFWLDNTTSGSGQQFQASWNGTSIYQSSSPGAFSWTNLQFIVTANAAGTVLQFGAENDAAYFGLDDIGVTHVPALTFKTAIRTNGIFNLAWATATGLVYQVQYKTNLLQTNWLSLIKPTTAASTNLSATDTSSSSQRFYRLGVAP
ncbi:MAG: protease pro-enzyme activation domain-containing protein [Verrucomicrobiae bacterium]|nr:protease pro-enzyme activation domain-containing protein [Verrucomicrobiae bacterium]